MNLRYYVPGLLAASLAVCQPALAQQPQILLDPPPSGAAPTQPLTAEPETRPSAGTQEAPQIQLPPPASADSQAVEAPASPVIPERDRGEDAMPAVARDWLMPLIPTSRLADKVQIGASQPAPGILRLTGEVASVDLRLDLPQDATIPAALMLTLRSAVNILPDVAAITISVNDAPPVVMPLNHLGGFATVGVPATGLTVGTNRVRLELRQPHRIYCGPEASFGVWTEINLPQSGVPVDPGTMTADATGFALALRAQTATGLALPVLVTEDEDATVLRQLAGMLSRISDGQALIEFRSFYGLEAPSPLSIALISSDRSHAELREGAAGGLVLQVEHADGQLPPLDDLLPKLPGLSTAIPAMTPGVTTSLAELGQQDIIGRTRYFWHEVPFHLPSDWLLMSNQKARLQLGYGFADALPQGATLLVKANGQTIRLLPLDRGGGQMQEPLDIVFPANLLHGGQNSLVFEMMVPGNPPDAICLPRRADMLVVTSDSTLLVPPAPAMGLSGMASPLSGLGPEGVVVPDGVIDPATLERAAAEVIAGLAPQSGSADPSVRLNMIDIRDISVMPLEHLGISVRDLQESLVEIGVRSAPATAPAATEPSRRYQLTEEDAQPVPQPAADGGDIPDPAGSFSLGEWVANRTTWLKSATFVGSDESLSAWLDTQQGRALLLRPNTEEPNDLWLVLGPDVSVETALKGLLWLRDSGLATGEAAILADDSTWQIWSPVRPPELHEPLRLSNLRTVLGNYASWSPLLFTLSILGLALLSAIPALLFILFTRRRGQL